ncbi:hypothetical protein HYV80_01480 [Candidatus Woesearchaeota archaeon]|nr:hypothetical protein [Candidatus Woesearchaeota archaeon]
MRKILNKQNQLSKNWILLFALVITAALLNSVSAAQDFIIENRTSSLFVVNGTTGNIIMAPSFGLVGIGILGSFGVI